jgi:hypothetical protein
VTGFALKLIDHKEFWMFSIRKNVIRR